MSELQKSLVEVSELLSSATQRVDGALYIAEQVVTKLRDTEDCSISEPAVRWKDGKLQIVITMVKLEPDNVFGCTQSAEYTISTDGNVSIALHRVGPGTVNNNSVESVLEHIMDEWY